MVDKKVDEKGYVVKEVATQTAPSIFGPEGEALDVLEVLARIAEDTRVIREKLVGK